MSKGKYTLKAKYKKTVSPVAIAEASIRARAEAKRYKRYDPSKEY